MPSSVDWTSGSPTATPRSSSPPSGTGEEIFNKYIDIIHSKQSLQADAKQSEPLDRPFDFFDDEEFAFGINLLNNNVACVGENITKLIQMAQEPWPDNVKLFQPYEVEQILLPDNASCLAVQAFLKMCNLPFEVEMRWNAEFMSPSGRVPFIKCGAFVVSELEPIVQFAANKGVTLCSKLSSEEKAEMRAYMSLITNVLVNAELYISWIDSDTYNAVTKVRNSSVYPWPLGWLQTRAKRNAVAKRLKALHWHDKTLEQVLSDVEQCCNSLSQRLGDKDYFFGNTPTALDALVFGHVRALLSANGPKAALMIKPITTSLLKLVVKMVAVTSMGLSPQEEYLITQAFQVTRRRLSPERTVSERSTRVRKSRLCLRNSRDSINYNRDTFGFKPFASKQIVIMTSKEGALTCTYDAPKPSSLSIKMSDQNFAVEIIEDILDKVEELSFDGLNDKLDYEKHDFQKQDNEKNGFGKSDYEKHDFEKSDYEKHDFEKSDYEKHDFEKSDYEKHDFEIVYPNDGDAKFGNVVVKLNEYLDTIEENATDSIMSADASDDQTLDTYIRIIHDEDTDDLVEDSDGMVNDKHLASQPFENESGQNICIDSDVTDSSNNNNMKVENSLTATTSGDGICNCREKSYLPTSASSGSKSTLKMPSDEEISVESLLKYLRERNAAYGSYIDVADID